MNMQRQFNGLSEALSTQAAAAVAAAVLFGPTAVTGGGRMLSPCDRAPWSGYGYCNRSLGTDARLDDLLDRMTTQDMIDAMDGSAFPTVFAECDEVRGPRHDPPLLVDGITGAQHSECLHGVVEPCLPGGVCPTSFPNPGALGASFNRSLWRHIGDVIGMERRAIANTNGGPSGFSCWAPNINTGRWDTHTVAAPLLGGVHLLLLSGYC